MTMMITSEGYTLYIMLQTNTFTENERERDKAGSQHSSP